MTASQVSPSRWHTSATRGAAQTVMVVAAAAVLALACTRPPAAGDFRVGASRDELVAAFGEPLRMQRFDRRGGGVLGPIEDFWPSVPAGSTVEVWVYRVEGGTVELYFVDGSARVQGRGFAPEGTVFEAGGTQRTSPD